MTTKQIAHLKSLAMNLKPVLQVGKLGVHDSLIEVIEKHLDANELMKVSLLKNSDIYIFDEAFSQIDPEKESQIMKNVFAYLEGKTVIVVSHRLLPFSDNRTPQPQYQPDKQFPSNRLFWNG